MKHLDRKIKNALFILGICLMAFVGFSKAGILFSDGGRNVITVSTTKKTFDPNNYVASMNAAVAQKGAIPSTVTTETTTQVTTTVATTKVVTTTVVPTTTKWSGDVLSKVSKSSAGFFRRCGFRVFTLCCASIRRAGAGLLCEIGLSATI